MFSGSANGTIQMWDTTIPPMCDDSSEPTIQPVHTYVAHGDCVNGVRYSSYCSRESSTLHTARMASPSEVTSGVNLPDLLQYSPSLPSLHPTLPLLASTSGQRKFPVPMEYEVHDEAVDSDTEPEDDNSLRLWALSCVNTEGWRERQHNSVPHFTYVPSRALIFQTIPSWKCNDVCEQTCHTLGLPMWKWQGVWMLLRFSWVQMDVVEVHSRKVPVSTGCWPR